MCVCVCVCVCVFVSVRVCVCIGLYTYTEILNVCVCVCVCVCIGTSIFKCICGPKNSTATLEENLTCFLKRWNWYILLFLLFPFFFLTCFSKTLE